MSKELWLRVSRDEYELPEVVADTVQELAWRCGVSINAVRSNIGHYNKGDLKRCKYVRVEVEDEDETDK